MARCFAEGTSGIREGTSGFEEGASGLGQGTFGLGQVRFGFDEGTYGFDPEKIQIESRHFGSQRGPPESLVRQLFGQN